MLTSSPNTVIFWVLGVRASTYEFWRDTTFPKCYQVQAHTAHHTTGQYIKKQVAGARNSDFPWKSSTRDGVPKNLLSLVIIQVSFFPYLFWLCWVLQHSDFSLDVESGGYSSCSVDLSLCFTAGPCRLLVLHKEILCLKIFLLLIFTMLGNPACTSLTPQLLGLCGSTLFSNFQMQSSQRRPPPRHCLLGELTVPLLTLLAFLSCFWDSHLFSSPSFLPRPVPEPVPEDLGWW